MYTHPLLDRDKITPREALEILVEGNRRFSDNVTANRDVRQLLQITKDKQHPFASVLSCSDSRAPVEMLFDQALGDIFSVRLAGNIATNYAIASLEFGTKYLGSKLIVVLGHSSCGAIKAACDDFKDGHITQLIELIKPAVVMEKTESQTRNSGNADFVMKVCELNIRHQMHQIVYESEIIQKQLEARSIGIVGASYDLSTGKVKFYEDTFIG
ncbi:MAG: carbonic anhydrase [Candidatus Methylopumilus sp.]|jgi:carbonic anhydrase|nr:carbonic anhydrase [Candidatus Methylopumilus sp.]